MLDFCRFLLLYMLLTIREVRSEDVSADSPWLRRTRRPVATNVRKSGLAIPALGSLSFSSHVVETKMD